MPEENKHMPSQDPADSERSGDRRLSTCWAEFNVEIHKDRWNREMRMAKYFEFRTIDEKRDIPLAMALAYEFASSEKWENIEITVKRLDDPGAVNLLPTIEETRKILLPNVPTLVHADENLTNHEK